MYSPASQKLAVGSTVNENVDKAITKTTKAITLFKKRKSNLFIFEHENKHYILNGLVIVMKNKLNVLITVLKKQFFTKKNWALKIFSFFIVLSTILKIWSNTLDYILSKPLIDKNEVKEIKSHLQSDFG